MQSEDGTVPREYVVRILTENKVSMLPQKDSTDGSMVLAKDNFLEVHVILDPVSRRMIHRFARKFNIPIHLFYN